MSLSSFEKLILNRKKGLRQSPQRRIDHQKTSSTTKSSYSSKSFLSLLKGENLESEDGRGELHHVWNPNHSESKFG
jgi:hypothetical protein